MYFQCATVLVAAGAGLLAALLFGTILPFSDAIVMLYGALLGAIVGANIEDVMAEVTIASEANSFFRFLGGALFGGMLGAIPGIIYGFLGGVSSGAISAGIVGTIVVASFSAVTLALPSMAFGALIGGVVALAWTILESPLRRLEGVGPAPISIGIGSARSNLSTTVSNWPVWLMVAGTGLLFLAGIVRAGLQPCGWLDSRLDRSACLHVLAEPRGSVQHLTFGPGDTLLSTATDGTLRWWEISTGMLQDTRLGNSDSLVSSVAFSPDRTFVARATPEYTVEVVRLDEGTVVHVLEAHTARVGALAFSPDGMLLASGSADRSIRLWHVADWTLLRTLREHEAGVARVAFSPDGTTLASAGHDDVVHLWNVADGSLQQTLAGHTDGVSAITFSNDGRSLVSGALDAGMVIWDLAGGTQRATVEYHARPVKTIVISPSGAMGASGDGAGVVSLWHMANADRVQEPLEHPSAVQHLAFSPAGDMLAVGTATDGIWLWAVPVRTP